MKWILLLMLSFLGNEAMQENEWKLLKFEFVQFPCGPNAAFAKESIVVRNQHDLMLKRGKEMVQCTGDQSKWFQQCSFVYLPVPSKWPVDLKHGFLRADSSAKKLHFELKVHYDKSEEAAKKQQEFIWIKCPEIAEDWTLGVSIVEAH